MKRLEQSLKHCADAKAFRDNGGGFIYVIQDGDCVKIGHTNDVDKRLWLLQIGNPRKLTLLKAWKTTTAQLEEECLHEKYDAWRVRGEWFKLPESELSALLTQK